MSSAGDLCKQFELRSRPIESITTRNMVMIQILDHPGHSWLVFQGPEEQNILPAVLSHPPRLPARAPARYNSTFFFLQKHDLFRIKKTIDIRIDQAFCESLFLFNLSLDNLAGSRWVHHKISNSNDNICHLLFVFVWYDSFTPHLQSFS